MGVVAKRNISGMEPRSCHIDRDNQAYEQQHLGIQVLKT
jgi:hypothetical protein